MNISFWNTHRNKNINKFLISLIINNNIDIMILAEYEDNINSLINDLYLKNLFFEKIVFLAYNKIHAICKKNIDVYLKNDNSNYASTLIIKENIKFDLFMVHLSSNIHSDDDTRCIVTNELKNDIERCDENIIVVGDFNSNPFESSVSGFSGLLALPTKEYLTRTLKGVRKHILYNPMWKFYGNGNYVNGTYFYNNNKNLNYYWNLFDQVLLSQKLASSFDDNTLQIIKEINNVNLLKRNRNNKLIIDKNISDHLPILFSIVEEKNGRSLEQKV